MPSIVPRTIHTLRLELQEVEPAIWRTFEVDGGIRLDQFHEILQVVMGWTNSHLHGYSSRPPFERVGSGTPPIIEWLMESSLIEQEVDGIDEMQATLSSALAATGGRLYYTYDFGDNWLHLITEISAKPADLQDPVVRILEGAHAAPPEDCGGIGGFANLQRVLGGEDTEERTDLQAWLDFISGGWNPYAPSAFDAEATRRQLDFICHLQGIGRERFDPESATMNRLGKFLFERSRRGEPDGPRVFLALLMVAAGLDPLAAPVSVPFPEGIDPHTGCYQWILREALDEGIKLTAAGWMTPAVVKKAYAELDFGRELYFWEPVGSESKSTTVAGMRASAVGVGLLKVEGKKLTVTAAGKRLLEEPGKLWGHLASRAVEPRLEASRLETTLLILMERALDRGEGNPVGWEAAVAQGLTWLGYQNADGSPISDVWWSHSSERLGGIDSSLNIGHRAPAGRAEATRAFARAVLLS
ncbi:hypothetical protein GCM10023166_00180 [Paeniglutamicibacter cryotolerans]